jgi:surfactin synthase thioesterase subunit
MTAGGNAIVISPDASISLKCLAPRPMATLRLLCIPHAGGGAFCFRGWPALLPAGVEVFAVQLPGREDRLDAPAFDTWLPMMAALTEAVALLPPLPTAIFGHSLGAVIALELGRWMRARQPGRLRRLYVSGYRWPGSTGDGQNDLAALADADLLQALDQMYGSLSTSLSHPDIRDLMLPILRADLGLLATYRYAVSPALDCPLTVFAGRDDPATTSANLEAWHQECRGPFRIRIFDGQHFFMETHRAPVIAAIASSLEDADDRRCEMMSGVDTRTP